MPQASIFAFARSCVLDPDGSYFVTRMRPLNGNRTPLPSSQSMSRMSRRWCWGRRSSCWSWTRSHLGRFHVTAQPSRSRHRSARVVRRNDDDHRHDVRHRDLTICWGRHPFDRQAYRLQAPFHRRPTAGLKLLGFAIRERRGGCHVAFPARQYIPDRRGPDPIQWTVSPCWSLVVVCSSFS